MVVTVLLFNVYVEGVMLVVVKKGFVLVIEFG